MPLGDENRPNFYYFIMKIDKPLISRLEELARLELSDAEREALRADLNEILAMVEKLDELDLEGVEPLLYVNEVLHAPRPDRVQGQLSREEALRNAPQSDGEFFLLPKVIDL